MPILRNQNTDAAIDTQPRQLADRFVNLGDSTIAEFHRGRVSSEIEFQRPSREFCDHQVAIKASVDYSQESIFSNLDADQRPTPQIQTAD